MDNKIYYGVTTFFYLFVITLGMFVEDLGIVIDFATTFGISCLCFIWPGYFYLTALNKFGNKNDPREKKYIIQAYI